MIGAYPDETTKAFKEIESGEKEITVRSQSLSVFHVCEKMHQNTTVETLRFEFCNFNAMFVVTNMLKVNNTLKHLFLPYNDITFTEQWGRDIQTVLETKTNLETLDLCSNLIKDEGLLCITNGLEKNESLRHLDVSKNQIFDVGPLMKVLETNHTLTTLNLSGNQIDMEPIATMLKVNTTLTELHIDSVQHDELAISVMEGSEFIPIAEALKENNTLKVLHAKHWRWDDESLNVLKDALQMNRDNDGLDWFHLGKDMDGMLFENGFVKKEWSVERHAQYPLFFKAVVMQLMLMWNHDQYEEKECEGIRWNELPLEVVMNVIKWLAYDEELINVLDEDWLWFKESLEREAHEREEETAGDDDDESSEKEK